MRSLIHAGGSTGRTMDRAMRPACPSHDGIWLNVMIEGYDMKFGLFLTAAAISLPLSPALAQSESAADDYTVVSNDEREIVVTASGIEQERGDTGHAISVLDHDDLVTSQVVSISDALRTIPGVAVARSGPVGSQTSVFIRGGESSQTLVLVDGVRINDPSSPNAAFDFGALLTGNIDRVEILRGANSVIWGSQAIGGVINVQTIAPTETLAVNARAEYGSHDTAQAYGNISGKTGIVSGSVGAGYYRTDGIPALAAGTEKDGYENFSGNGKLLVEFSPSFALDLRGYYNKGRVEFDDPFGATPDTFPETENEQFVGYVGLNHSLIDDRWKGRLSFSHTDLTRTGTEPGVPFSFNENRLRGKVDRYAYDGSFDVAEIATIVFGAAHEETFASTFFPAGGGSGSAPDKADTRVTGGYGQLTLRPVAGLSLTGGVRHDDYSQYGGQTTFGANFTYSPNDGRTVFRGSYAEGFRAPTLTEALLPYGNPDLKPETSKGFDAGIEHSFLDNKVTASATWFNRKSNDAIIYSMTTYQSENIAKVRAEGVELGLSIRPVDNLSVQAHYALVDATSRTPGANFGHELARRPKDSASFAIDWKSPWGLSLGSTLIITGDSYDNLANTVRLDGFALASLRAAFPVTDAIELYGRVENLFDEDYQTVANYNSYGRTATVGVRARF